MPNGLIQIDKDTFQEANSDTKFNMMYDLMAHMYESQDAMNNKMVSKARRDATLTASSGLVGGFIAMLISRALKGWT